MSQHLPQEPTPPCHVLAFVPPSALPLPSWGMHKKPQEPEAKANRSVGLPTAERSPRPLLGTSLLCGVPHSQAMVQHGGQGAAALAPAWGQVPLTCPSLAPSHHRAPQPRSCLLLTPPGHHPRAAALLPPSVPGTGLCAGGSGCPQGSSTSLPWGDKQG